MADPSYNFDGIEKAKASDAPSYNMGGIDKKPPATSPPAEKQTMVDHVGNSLRSLWQEINVGQLLPFPKSGGGSGLDHPLLPQNVVNSMHAVKKEADARWDKGDKVGAAAKYIESVIPMLGPWMSERGNEAERGEWDKLIGHTIGFATMTKATANPQATADAAAAVPAKTGEALSAVGKTIEEHATSPRAKLASTVGAIDAAGQGHFKTAAAAVFVPKTAEFLGKGMQSLGELLKSDKPLTKAETQALQAKRFDPSIRTNKPVQEAITEALNERAPAAAKPAVEATTAAQKAVEELAAKVDPRVAGGAAPTEPTPAPKVSAVGVPDRATAPDASARAATMAEAVKGAEPPKASASASEPVAFDHNAAMQGTRKVFQQVNVKPLPAEISNAAEYMRFAAKRGEVVTPEAAVLREIAKRPGVPTAAIEAMTKKLEAQMEASAALAKKLGTADPAAVDAAVARRNATGAWQR